MAMNPRTHPRGAPPDFSMEGLPPNPNPARITDALWWYAQMCLRLEPKSKNGGILAIKPGYHSYGSRLPGHAPGGEGKATTDHSIRRAPDRRGPWWLDYSAAWDWTFDGAHIGDYTEINLYMRRTVNAMRSLTDLRPDDVFAYVIGQLDGDRQVEGWNEYKDENETGDDSHLWHMHKSFRRDIVGSFSAMWKALTIMMGWTYAEWQRSVAPPKEELPVKQADFNALFLGALKDTAIRKEVGQAMLSAVLGGEVVKTRTVQQALRDLMDERAMLRFPSGHPEAKAAQYPADSPLARIIAAADNATPPTGQ